MTDTVNLSIRINKGLKEQAENLFAELGLNITTAFNVFVRQVVRQRKIPFELTLDMPNDVTLAAMQELNDMRAGRKRKVSLTVADFVKKMRG
ncbi:MAG: type II toxin-antitoxin system RelB/DinJ family antitoxin [Candidatus Margulisbacteria bacterium]|jgi:DNA-damage-inducible protein J|nr:type II toxin-antitoxin system RelB/DinJ family antitoxin [Candidatus Margulisiibacteriota bacterium]